jgi:hypothetical protein
LAILTCGEHNNKVTINYRAAVLEYKRCFDLSSGFRQHVQNHYLMKLAKVAKRSLLQILGK